MKFFFIVVFFMFRFHFRKNLFLHMFLMCSIDFKFEIMVQPKYCADFTGSRLWPCSVNSLATGLRFLIIVSTMYLTGKTEIFHFVSQIASLLRFSCNFTLSASDAKVRYIKVLSAKSLTLDQIPSTMLSDNWTFWNAWFYIYCFWFLPF